MALYSISQRSTSTTSGNAASDMATSTGVRPRLMEMDLFNAAATASTFSLRRTSALGTRTTPTALLGEDPGDPVLTGITLVDSAVAFSVEPTELATKLRGVSFAANIGSGIIWTFPRGLPLAISLSFVIIHDATNSAAHDHTYVADV